MALTKNIRDGRLYLVGATVPSRFASYPPCVIHQSGSYYRFEVYNSAGTRRLRRVVSKNAFDFNSLTPANVMTIGSSGVSDISVVRESDNVWRLYFAQDETGSSNYSIYIATSTDQGATWGSATKIVSYGATWASTTLRSPAVATLGTRRVMTVCGNSSGFGVYYCSTSNDPTNPANWTAYTGNPIWTAPHANLTSTMFIAENGRLYCIVSYDETTGGDRTYQRVFELVYSGGAYSITTPHVVGSYASGANNEFGRGNTIYDPYNGLYVHHYVIAQATAPFTLTWVSETPDGRWWAVPGASPGDWTSLALECEIPEGGLSMTEDQGDVKIVMGRKTPDHLRRGKRGLTGELSFRPYDYSDVTTMMDIVSSAGRLDKVAAKHVALFMAGPTGAVGEFLILPSSIVKVGLKEGSEANAVSLSIECPLGNAIAGKTNTDAFLAAKDVQA